MRHPEERALVAAGNSLKINLKADNEVAPTLPVVAELAAAEGVRRIQAITTEAISTAAYPGRYARCIAWLVKPVDVKLRPCRAHIDTGIEARPDRHGSDNWYILITTRNRGVDVCCVCLRRNCERAKRGHRGADIFRARPEAKNAGKFHVLDPHLVCSQA